MQRKSQIICPVKHTNQSWLSLEFFDQCFKIEKSARIAIYILSFCSDIYIEIKNIRIETLYYKVEESYYPRYSL